MGRIKRVFRVPESDRQDFIQLAKDANLIIKENLKYIQQEGIQSNAAKRSILGAKANPSEWAGSRTPFSKSTYFKGFKRPDGSVISGEKEYKDYKRMLERIVNEGAYNPDNLKEGYYKSIIQSLNVVADNIGAGILTNSKKLPANLAKEVAGLTLEQMTHYFDNGDISEEMEYQPYSGEDYADVFDREGFVSVTMGRIETLKRLYPNKEQKFLLDKYGKRHPHESLKQLEARHRRNEQAKARRAAKRKK